MCATWMGNARGIRSTATPTSASPLPTAKSASADRARSGSGVNGSIFLNSYTVFGNLYKEA
ncbi:MAG: hypothetical protein ACLR8J_05270 [Sutterella wadsworthensis]